MSTPSDDAHPPLEFCRLADGRVMSFAQYGDPGGVAVMYCHGFPGSRYEAALGDAAARRLGIRLIAADRPGFGHSTLRPGRRFTDWPADLAALADSLGIARFHLLGVSGGGPYALACAQQLATRIDRIALVCAVGRLDQPDSTIGMDPVPAAAIRFYRAVPGLAYHAFGKFIGPLVRRDPKRVFGLLMGNAAAADRQVLADTQVRECLTESFAEAFHQGAEGPVQDLALLVGPWELDLRRVVAPVSLWHGDRDRTVPQRMGRVLARQLAHCDPHWIGGEGHISLIVRYLDDVFGALLGANSAA